MSHVKVHRRWRLIMRVKTGLLPTVCIVKVLCDRLKQYPVLALAIDPVMESTSGDVLAGPSILDTFRLPLWEEKVFFSSSSHKKVMSHQTPDRNEIMLVLLSVYPVSTVIPSYHVAPVH